MGDNMRIFLYFGLWLSLLTAVTHGGQAAAADDGYGSDGSSGRPYVPNVGETTGGGAELNGIRFADYVGFEKNWKLVTVTFRTDVNEMRFSYANDAAYSTLLAGSTNYPDGATFIKVAILTEGDPAFTASEVPGKTHRYQVMKYDRERYKNTDGWGYAVFVSTAWGYDVVGWDGKTARDTVQQMETKCHTCHTFVKHRNFVFSKIADMGAYASSSTPGVGGTVPLKEHQGITFRTDSRDSMPETLRQLVPDSFDKIRRVDGSLAKYAYIGAAYEARIALIIEALRSNLPAVYFKEDGGAMLIVSPTDKEKEPVSPDCGPDKKMFVSYWTIGGNPQSWPSKDLFCYNEETLPMVGRASP